MTYRAVSVLLTICLCTFTGCFKPPEDDRPSRIESISGNHQCGLPGEILPEPLMVRVLGQRSRDFLGRKGRRQPLVKQVVTFRLEGIPKEEENGSEPGSAKDYPTFLTGDGKKPGENLSRAEVETDASGTASVRIRLGNKNGDWRIEASVPSKGNKVLDEHFRVVSGVEKLADNIETTVGSDVPLSLRLQARDDTGKLVPLEGRTVHMRMAGEPAGNAEKASLNNRREETNKDGVRKGTDLTLGDRAGIYRVLAEVEGNEDDPPIRGIIFTVKAIDWLQIVGEITIGVIFFLLGVKFLANGFLIVLGPHLHHATGRMANNRILGYFGGALSGATFQSHSAVTSHLMSFVNGGLLKSRGAMGILLGALLGATALPQILSMQIDFLIAPLTGLGLLMVVLPRSAGLAHWSRIFLGGGLALASWDLLGSGIEQLELSSRFSADVLPTALSFSQPWEEMAGNFLTLLLIGAGISLVLRTTNLVVIAAILLASNGLMDAMSTAPLILGANLGVGLSCLFLSLFKTRDTCRLGISLLVIHLVACAGFAVLSLVHHENTSLLLWLVDQAIPGNLFHPLAENVEHHVAMIHTAYNLVASLLFLALPGIATAIASWILPPKADSDDLKPYRLDENLIPVPGLALRQVLEELCYLAELCQKNVAEAFDAFRYGDLNLAGQVARREEIIAGIHREASRYLVLIQENQLSRRESTETEKLQSSVAALSRVGESAEILRELASRRIEDNIDAAEELDRDLGE
ncbi:MAG: PhoU domain-containing protein, partial [Planctomycetota bacterium]